MTHIGLYKMMNALKASVVILYIRATAQVEMMQSSSVFVTLVTLSERGREWI